MSDKNNTVQTPPPPSAGGRRAGGGGRLGGMTFDKAKNSKKALLSLAKYMGNRLPLVIICMLLALGAAVVSVILPVKLAELFGVISRGLVSDAGINMAMVGNIAVIMLIMGTSASVSHYLQGLLMTDVVQKTARRFRTDIDKKINRLPLGYFDSRVFGDVLSRVTNDVDTISNSVNQGLLSFIFNVSLLIGIIFAMFFYNWILALVAVITIPLSLLIITGMAKYSQKHFRAFQRGLGELNGHIEEIYSGHEVVRAYSGEAKAKAAFDTINGKMAGAGWRSNFLAGLMYPMTHFVSNLGLMAVCVVGGILVANNTMPIEGIVAFFMFVRMFNQPVAQLAEVVAAMQSAAAASERVFEFLGENEMADEKDKSPIKIDEFKGAVEFKNIRFGYDPDHEIVHDFSATAEPGQKIAIVGPTGAGKTTIVNLLMRFYEVAGGEILIDGVPTSTMTRTQVHDLFGMVLQDTWLFEGTIKENIVYAKQGVTDDDVYAACKAAGIDHLIRSLPGSYDMVLDDAANLSAGQRQLITIARAIVEDAPMLILDEATSAVDSRTEVLIQAAMDKLTRGRTSFIIAHRLSTIKNADLILVMQDGGIIEQGNHEELMTAGGFYSELYRSQFENA